MKFALHMCIFYIRFAAHKKVLSTFVFYLYQNDNNDSDLTRPF